MAKKRVTKIRITSAGEAMAVMKVGERARLTATVLDQFNQSMKTFPALTWKSSGVAIVELREQTVPSIYAYGLSAGNVTVTASAAGVTSLPFAVSVEAVAPPPPPPPAPEPVVTTIEITAEPSEPVPVPVPEPVPVPVPEPTPTPVPTPTPTPTPGTKSLLTLADLQYLGYYDVQTNGNNTSFSQGLALRRVNGDLRLLITQFNALNQQNLHEISLSGHAFGDVIKTITNSWGGVQRRALIGLDHDPVTDRLLTTAANDYEAQIIPTQIFAHQLPVGGGAVVSHGPISLEGISAKRVYGGCLRAPSWFTAVYPKLTHWCGFGGYTSIVAGGGTASLGPTLYAIPDPLTIPAGTTIPAGEFKALMDHSSGTVAGQDWYGAGKPTTFDRGQRLPDVMNYYQNDPRGNTQQTTRPTDSPRAGATWLSPAPDGRGRCVWGDTFWNTGMWIDTPTRHGFALLQTVSRGFAWYANATLNADEVGTELHVFDPKTILEAAAGTIKPWLVRPASIERIDFPGLDFNVGVNITRGKAAGAKFDAATRRLYVAGFSVNTYFTRIYVYQL